MEIETPLARARRASLATTLREAMDGDLSLWVFCTWCGHSHMIEPWRLKTKADDPVDALDELERRLHCSKCGRQGARLIPTDSTMVSFDRMGIRAEMWRERQAKKE